MKLANRYIDTMLDIDAAYVNTIVIEAPPHYTDNIKQLYRLRDKEESTWVFSRNYTPLELGEGIEILVDYINVDFNSKKILTGLSKFLIKEMSQQNFKFQEYYQSGYKLISDILLELLPEIELSDTIDQNAIVKLFSPRVAVGAESLVETLARYVNALIEFTTIKVLVCVGLKCYLSREDFEQFASHMAVQQLPLICIESSETYRIDGEKLLLIDCDLCEIVL